MFGSFRKCQQAKDIQRAEETRHEIRRKGMVNEANVFV